MSLVFSCAFCHYICSLSDTDILGAKWLRPAFLSSGEAVLSQSWDAQFAKWLLTKYFTLFVFHSSADVAPLLVFPSLHMKPLFVMPSLPPSLSSPSLLLSSLPPPSLIPRARPLTRRNGLVKQVKFVGLAHETSYGQRWNQVIKSGFLVQEEHSFWSWDSRFARYPYKPGLLLHKHFTEALACLCLLVLLEVKVPWPQNLCLDWSVHGALHTSILELLRPFTCTQTARINVRVIHATFTLLYLFIINYHLRSVLHSHMSLVKFLSDLVPTQWHFLVRKNQVKFLGPCTKTQWGPMRLQDCWLAT